MSKGRTPAAPDYVGAAREQGSANLQTAIASSQLSNPNIVSPFGTRTVSYSGGGFNQSGFDQAMSQWQQQMNAIPNQPDYDEQGRIMGDPYSYARLELSKRMPTRDQFTSPSLTPTITETLDPKLMQFYERIGQGFDVSQIPGIGDTSINRNSVRDALVARQEESIGRDRENTRSDLIARGIPEGSEAFNREMARLDRMTVDARQQAELGAGQAQQQALESRRQLIQEALLGRQTPINELSALRSGTQLSGANFGGAQIAPPNIMGATDSSYGAALDQANARNAAAAQNTNAAASLIGAYLMMPAAASDIRLKSNIVKVGEHPLGIGIYEYDIDGIRESGVMAQELLEVMPEAVMLMPSGYYGVYYDMIGGRP